MNVFLLGAGASKAYTNANNKQSMPLARDFFKTFNNLNISSNPYVLIGYFVEYIKEYYRVSPTEFSNYNEDIEVIHSDIHQRLIEILNKGFPSNGENTAESFLVYNAYIELIFLFNSVINEIQNGDISKTHIKLVEALGPDDAIVTFNWDTLIDRALEHCTDWCCETGYWVKPKAIYDNKWIANDTSNISQIANKNNAPILIKLHGSTNWLTGYPRPQGGKLLPDQTSSYETFYAYKSTSDPYPTYQGRFFQNYQPFSYGYYPVNIPEESIPVPKGYTKIRTLANYDSRINDDESPYDDGLTSMPAIIPPVKRKEYDMFGKLFDSLWHKAEEVISKADNIFIIGYSFPVTDIKSHELFHRAFVKRKSMPHVFIINPHPESVSNIFCQEMGIDTEHLHIIEEYFSEEFDFGVFHS